MTAMEQKQQQQQLLLDSPLPPPLHHPPLIHLPSQYSYSPDLFSPPAQYTPTPPPLTKLGDPTRPPAPPLNLPPSPTRHQLLPPSLALERKRRFLVPGRVGRVEIQLARDCAFGPDRGFVIYKENPPVSVVQSCLYVMYVNTCTYVIISIPLLIVV